MRTPLIAVGTFLVVLAASGGAYMLGRSSNHAPVSAKGNNTTTTTTRATTTTTTLPPSTTTIAPPTTAAVPVMTTTTAIPTAIVPDILTEARQCGCSFYAQQSLKQAGFSYQIVDVYSPSCQEFALPGETPGWNGGAVVGQAPAAGSSVPVGSVIEIEECASSPPP